MSVLGKSFKCLGIALICVLILSPASTRADVTVFAASSLHGVLQDLHAQSEQNVTTSVAGSATLARQIAHGAPADVFISANTDWMEWLVENAHIDAENTTALLSNRLVLVSADPQRRLSQEQLADALGAQQIAMGQINAVPAGTYGKDALTSLGLWDRLRLNVVQTESVAAAMRLVALGEISFGIGYKTDVIANDRLHVAYTFPEESHAPIRYHVGNVSQTAEAKSYIGFLQSEAAQNVFLEHGFRVLIQP